MSKAPTGRDLSITAQLAEENNQLVAAAVGQAALEAPATCVRHEDSWRNLLVRVTGLDSTASRAVAALQSRVRFNAEVALRVSTDSGDYRCSLLQRWCELDKALQAEPPLPPADLATVALRTRAAVEADEIGASFDGGSAVSDSAAILSEVNLVDPTLLTSAGCAARKQALLAQCHLMLGEFAAAALHAEAATVTLARNVGLPDAWLLWAEALVQGGKYAQAIDVLLNALDGEMGKTPDNILSVGWDITVTQRTGVLKAVGRNLLGCCYARLENMEAALLSFDAAFNSDSTAPYLVPLYNCAVLFHQLGLVKAELETTQLLRDAVLCAVETGRPGGLVTHNSRPLFVRCPDTASNATSLLEPPGPLVAFVGVVQKACGCALGRDFWRPPLDGEAALVHRAAHMAFTAGQAEVAEDDYARLVDAAGRGDSPLIDSLGTAAAADAIGEYAATKLALGKDNECVDLCCRVEKVRPGDTTAALCRLVLSLKKALWPEVARRCGTFAEKLEADGGKLPGSVECWIAVTRARALEANGDAAGGLEQLRRAARNRPWDTHCIEHMVAALRRGGHDEEAAVNWHVFRNSKVNRPAAADATRSRSTLKSIVTAATTSSLAELGLDHAELDAWAAHRIAQLPASRVAFYSAADLLA